MAGVNPLWVSLRTDEFPLQHDQSAKSRNAHFIAHTRLNLDSGAKGFSPYRDNLRTPLLIMMGMVMLVMAMAIVNVASLLLVRAASRVREFSMRFALGATNGQIFRQLLAEGLLLGISSAALGLFSRRSALELSSPGWPGAIQIQPFPPRSIGGFCSSLRPRLSSPACSLASPPRCNSGIRVSPSLSSNRPGPAPEAQCSSAAPAWRCRSASACC